MKYLLIVFLLIVCSCNTREKRDPHVVNAVYKYCVNGCLESRKTQKLPAFEDIVAEAKHGSCESLCMKLMLD